MRRFLTVVVPAMVILIALAGQSCTKKTYSNDEPFDSTFGSMLYVASNNQVLRALDPATGKQQWEYRLNANISATPFLDDKGLYAITDNGVIHMLNANNGNLLKQFSRPQIGFSSPVGDSTLLYFTGGMASPFSGALDSLYAYSPTTGTLRWSVKTAGYVPGSPMLYANRLYFGTDSGKFFSVNKSNGVTFWENDTNVIQGSFYSSPVRMGGLVYAANSDSYLYAFDINTGELKWRFKANGAIFSSPAAINGSILFGAEDYTLYCVDSTTKAIRWKANQTQAIRSSPVYASDKVFVGGLDGTFYAYSFIDGSLKWSAKIGLAVESSPVVSEGIVYVGANDGYIYAFDVENGVLKWKYLLGGQIATSPIVRQSDNKVIYPTVTGASKK